MSHLITIVVESRNTTLLVITYVPPIVVLGLQLLHKQAKLLHNQIIKVCKEF